jgi:hypothetical protein
MQMTGFAGATSSVLKVDSRQAGRAALFASVAVSEVLSLEPVTGIPSLVTLQVMFVPERRSTTLSAPLAPKHAC